MPGEQRRMRKIKLQLAVDLADSQEIMNLVEPIADVVDILEIGTPMIIKEGLKAVRMVKRTFPDLTVLADTKIVDGGRLECMYAAEAGADIITVLAVADDSTIRSVAETAHSMERKVMADLLNVNRIPERAVQLREMGCDYVVVHTGVDAQGLGRTPYLDLQELTAVLPLQMCAVAGGISQDNIALYRKLEPEIIVSGSALTSSPDIRSAVLEMKKVLNS